VLGCAFIGCHVSGNAIALDWLTGEHRARTYFQTGRHHVNIASIISDSTLAIAVTAGLTETVKRAFPAQIKDQAAYITTVAVGLLVTGGFDYAQFAPATAQDWTVVVLHGLVVGLSAAGLYRVGSAIAAKAKTA
jgi:hypothetical protein